MTCIYMKSNKSDNEFTPKDVSNNNNTGTQVKTNNVKTSSVNWK